MNTTQPAGLEDDPYLARQVDQWLRQYVGELPAASAEGLRRLVGDLVARQQALEADLSAQRQALQQLEAYRDRYVDLYDFAPLGYITLDAEGYVQEINLAGAWLLGSEREQMVGYPFTEFVAAADRARCLEHVRRCCAGRAEMTSELRLIAKDGRTITVQFHSVPMPAVQEEETFCKTAITDITAVKRAQEAIQEERNLLRTLIDNLPDLIYVKDTGGRFLAANLPAAQIMGAATPQDLLGRTDAEFYPADLAAEYRADERRLLQSGQPLINKDEPHRDATGAARAVLTTKLPLKDSAGRVIGLVGISRDITERKRTEEAILRLNEQLQAANRELEAFTSSVCHDLRRPLQTIGGFGELLAEEYAARLDETALDYLARIRDGVKDMDALIGDLLQLARVSQADVKRAVVDLSALARAIAESLRHAQPERQVTFVIPAGLAVSGDAQLLRVALENLLGNAWKFTSKHVAARIEFGAAEQNGEPVYFVRDDGAGFDMRQAHQLFDVFRRLHSPEEFEGTGVGLSTVARIVRAHGGRLWAEGAVERGATFFFTLPNAAAP